MASVSLPCKKQFQIQYKHYSQYELWERLQGLSCENIDYFSIYLLSFAETYFTTCDMWRKNVNECLNHVQYVYYPVPIEVTQSVIYFWDY